MASAWSIYTAPNTDIPKVHLYGTIIPLTVFDWSNLCIFSCYNDHLGILDTSNGVAKVYAFDVMDSQIYIDTELYEGISHANEWLMTYLKFPKLKKTTSVQCK